MSNIDISIWGIRDGFQQGGFFHSHNFASVKEIQQDRFRSVKNAIGREGFFMTHRKGGKYIVTYCDTSIKEYNPTSKRGAYVCFSLIIDESLAFSCSPRATLKELATFYVDRVGDTNSNNFDAEDIQTYLRKIQTVQKPTTSAAQTGSHYLYYTGQDKIDEVLTGKLAYVNLSELILIPNHEIDSKIDFYDDSFGPKPSFFNVNSAQEKEKQDQQEREKERIRVQEEIGKGKQLDSDIAILLSQNKLDEAIKLYEDAPAGIKSKISQQVANDLKHRLQKRDSDDVENRKRQEDKEKIDEINTALLNGDLDSAVLSYNKLHDKFTKDLPEEKRKQIQAHNTKKLEDEARIQKEATEIAKKTANSKKRLKIILFSSLAGILILFIVSFFTAVPAAMWDTDKDGHHDLLADDCPNEFGTINGCSDKDHDKIPDNKDNCQDEKGSVNGCPDSDKDGVIDSDDKCPDKAGKVNGCPEDKINDKSPLSPVEDVAQQDDIDSLLNNEAVTTPKNGSFSGQIVAGKWLRFKNKNYEYSDFKNKQFKPVTSQVTVDLLNNYYGLNGNLTQGVTTTTPTTTTNPPKTGKKHTPPTTTNPPKKIMLTPDEQVELDNLLNKERNSTLSKEERKRKNELINKKG
jgi:hypothetical protein